MPEVLRIGTRESQLAVWQATLVQQHLKDAGYSSELVYIKSEGDIDVVTPLYALGVQGIFTKTLDAALLSNKIDLAVHSMKDVPTRLAYGIAQAAVLERASYQDILVYKNDISFLDDFSSAALIASSSIRRIAQWKHRYPKHHFENLRGNVNTRLKKVADNNWEGAIFAAAGLERIGLRPQKSITLDWMLPSPAQGAIMVVCRDNHHAAYTACQTFHHRETALCTKAERDFLSTLMGGCSTPISALATIQQHTLYLEGNIVTPDGLHKLSIQKEIAVSDAANIGIMAANELLLKDEGKLVERLRENRKPA